MKLKYFTMDDFDVDGKAVLVRLDLNSPMDPHTGKILDDKRLWSHTETLKRLEKAKTVVLAHQSRPGKSDFTTMEPHAKLLNRIVRQKVTYIDDIFGPSARRAIEETEIGEVLLLENVRFYSEEGLEQGPEEHAKTHLVSNLTPHFELFINDAFGSAHRSHASMVGFTHVVPSAAGKLMEKEISILDKVLVGSDQPRIFVLGGTKTNDAIDVIKNVLSNDVADRVLVSGVVANVFLAASGVDIGTKNMQLIEKQGGLDGLPMAKALLKKFGSRIAMPIDVALNKKGKRFEVKIDALPVRYPIFDIGIESTLAFADEIKNAGTVVLNGAAGVFEEKDFALGTFEILEAATKAKFAVIGGGHSGAAMRKAGLEKKVAHMSTGGGACIVSLAGRGLPAIAALRNSAKRFKSRR